MVGSRTCSSSDLRAKIVSMALEAPIQCPVIDLLAVTGGIDDVVDSIKEYTAINNQATAYVCLNQTCKAPTTDIEEMLKLLT